MESFIYFISNHNAIIIGISAALISICFLTNFLIDVSGMACCCYQKKMYEFKTSLITAIAGIGFFGLGVGEVPSVFYVGQHINLYYTVLNVGVGSILTGIGFIIYGIRGWIRTRANKLKQESERYYSFSYVGLTALPGLFLLCVTSFLNEGFTLVGVGYIAIILSFFIGKLPNIYAKGLAYALSGFGIIHLGGDYVILAMGEFKYLLGL